MKPGKPLTFATILVEDRTKIVFGLPGNPVSSMTTFLLFCIPAIRKFSGSPSIHLPVIQAKLSHSISLDKYRPEYHRAYLKWVEGTGYLAESTGIQVSSRLLSFRSANTLLILPQGEGSLEAGTIVDAYLIGSVHR